jgi:hypothetical protein
MGKRNSAAVASWSLSWFGILPVWLACAIPRNGREGAGWRLWNIGTWNTLSSHAELAAGLGARILAFRLHTPRYMCIPPAVHIFIAHRVTSFSRYLCVQFSFVFVFWHLRRSFFFLSVLAFLALSHRDTTLAVTLWKEGIMWWSQTRLWQFLWIGRKKKQLAWFDGLHTALVVYVGVLLDGWAGLQGFNSESWGVIEDELDIDDCSYGDLLDTQISRAFQKWRISCNTIFFSVIVACDVEMWTQPGNLPIATCSSDVLNPRFPAFCSLSF